jgi:hypothetical protein
MSGRREGGAPAPSIGEPPLAALSLAHSCSTLPPRRGRTHVKQTRVPASDRYEKFAFQHSTPSALCMLV